MKGLLRQGDDLVLEYQKIYAKGLEQKEAIYKLKKNELAKQYNLAWRRFNSGYNGSSEWEKFLELWFEIEAENADLIFISVGGAGNSDQQFPEFLKDAQRRGKKVAILNIDPTIKAEEADLIAYNIPLKLSEDKSHIPGSSPYSKFDEILQKKILEYNKPLVLTSFIAGELFPNAKKIATQKPDTKFVVGGGGDDDNIVVIPGNSSSILNSRSDIIKRYFDLPKNSQKEITELEEEFLKAGCKWYFSVDGIFLSDIIPVEDRKEAAPTVKRVGKKAGKRVVFYDDVKDSSLPASVPESDPVSTSASASRSGADTPSVRSSPISPTLPRAPSVSAISDIEIDDSTMKIIKDFLNDSKLPSPEPAIIKNLKKAIDDQKNNPQPKTPYRGIGVLATVSEYGGENKKGLKIIEIFSPKNNRFTKNGVIEYPKENDIIVSIKVGTGSIINLDDILSGADRKKALEEIAGYFHSNDKIEFTTESGAIYSCDNRINKTAIFAEDKSNEPVAGKSVWRALSEIVNEEAKKDFVKKLFRDLNINSVMAAPVASNSAKPPSSSSIIAPSSSGVIAAPSSSSITAPSVGSEIASMRSSLSSGAAAISSSVITPSSSIIAAPSSSGAPTLYDPDLKYWLDDQGVSLALKAKDLIELNDLVKTSEYQTENGQTFLRCVSKAVSVEELKLMIQRQSYYDDSEELKRFFTEDVYPKIMLVPITTGAHMIAMKIVLKEEVDEPGNHNLVAEISFFDPHGLRTEAIPIVIGEGFLDIVATSFSGFCGQVVVAKNTTELHIPRQLNEGQCGDFVLEFIDKNAHGIDFLPNIVASAKEDRAIRIETMSSILDCREIVQAEKEKFFLSSAKMSSISEDKKAEAFWIKFQKVLDSSMIEHRVGDGGYKLKEFKKEFLSILDIKDYDGLDKEIKNLRHLSKVGMRLSILELLLEGQGGLGIIGGVDPLIEMFNTSNTPESKNAAYQRVKEVFQTKLQVPSPFPSASSASVSSIGIGGRDHS